MTKLKKQELAPLDDDSKTRLSHSLRSPLTCIKEAVRLVLDGVCGPLNKQQTEILKMAMKHIERLVKTIEDILKQDKDS